MNLASRLLIRRVNAIGRAAIGGVNASGIVAIGGVNARGLFTYTWWSRHKSNLRAKPAGAPRRA